MAKKTIRSADYLSIDSLEIILTGPFQTGNPFDFSQTTSDQYRRIQETVKDELSNICSVYEWTIPKSGGGQKYEMGAGGTGKAHSPSYYLECIVDCEEIECKFKKYNFTIEKMKIKFYEFGIATVSIFGVISLKSSSKRNEKINSSDLLCIVNDLDEKIVNGEVQKVKALISNVTKKFNRAIQENEIEKLVTNEKVVDATTNKKINDIEFLHRIFAYKVSKNSEIQVAQKTLDKIAKLSNGEWEDEKFCSHFVGVANSVIIYNFDIGRSCDNIDSEILKRYLYTYKTVLETANAYYFIAECIKNGLFEYSRESVVIEESKKLSINSGKFNKAETGLNKYIFLTSNFFSMSDEFIANLSPQDKNIWDRINEVWNTGSTAKILQDKLENSLQITDRVFTQTAKRSQKLTIWLAIGAIVLAEVSFDINISNFENNTDAIFSIDNSINLLLTFILIAATMFVLIYVVYPILKSLYRLLRNPIVWLIKIICKKIQPRQNR